MTRTLTSALFALAGPVLLWLSTPAHAQLVASVLPPSRSVRVGHAATAFATIINTGSSTASGCSIAPTTAVQASFLYQTTNPLTNQPTGTVDTPAAIPPGGAQTFLIAFTPTSTFAGTSVEFRFACANAAPAPVIAGVNTFTLFSESAPTPDVIGVAATPTYDGVLRVAGAIAAFAVAILNLGADQFGSVGLVQSEVAVDTGTVALPVSVSVCPTDLVSGDCLRPPTPGRAEIGLMATGGFRSLTVFVTVTGSVALDPAVNRVFIRLAESFQAPPPAGGLLTVTHDLTSIAIATLP